jgi:hypothetical protein
MIIKRFYKVNSNKIVICKLNFIIWYEKFRFFGTFLIIKRFFKVNSNKIVIFKLNFKF